jgi:phosphatidylglycerophosphate synthase
MEERGIERAGERDLLGRAADGLTAYRAFVALALVPALGARRIGLAAALLGTGWISDFLDGRAARASAGPTRLGGSDLWIDTLVGAGAVLGCVAAGWVPPALGVGLVVLLLAGFGRTRNEALSMLLQATGYGMVLWRTWSEGHGLALAWLLTVIAAIGVVNRRIFWERSVPTFLGGLAALVRGPGERD